MAQLAPVFPDNSPPPPSWFFRPSLALPPPPPSNDKPYSQGRIVANICIGTVTSYIVFSTVYILFKGYRSRRARAAGAAADTRRRPLPEHGSALVDELQPHQASATSPTAGLPAFLYSQPVKHKLRGGGEAAATCSVCLGEFQAGETVRLLPMCLHMYHAGCIDPWLDAHSTCPLCRSDTDPTTAIGRRPPV